MKSLVISYPLFDKFVCVVVVFVVVVAAAAAVVLLFVGSLF